MLCEATVAYECTSQDTLRRIRTYACGTHQACREHDDCLDRCRERRARGLDCDAVCHSEAVQRYGFEHATSWIAGAGPFDATPITFDYTRDTPQGPEPAFRCPGGSQPVCSDSAGRCVTSTGREVTPIFDRYVGGTGTARVSGFRSGRICRDGAGAPGVCEEAELADAAAPGSVLVREVRCAQNGSPVVETTFRLHFAGR